MWLFFDEALPAALARRLGSHLLTEAMEGRPDIGLDSYDRLFPNQDTLPQGGFGNLIALPLQKRARDRGTACFSTTTSCPGPISGRSLRVCAGSAERRSKPSSRTPSVGVGSSAFVCRQKTMTMSRGPRLRRGGDATRPWPASCRRLELVLGNQIYVAKEGSILG